MISLSGEIKFSSPIEKGIYDLLWHPNLPIIELLLENNLITLEKIANIYHLQLKDLLSGKLYKYNLNLILVKSLLELIKDTITEEHATDFLQYHLKYAREVIDNDWINLLLNKGAYCCDCVWELPEEIFLEYVSS
nr:hypothetical protein [Nitrosopumilus sp.]